MSLLQTRPRETVVAIFVTAFLVGLVFIGLLTYVSFRTMGGADWTNDPNDLNNLHAMCTPIGAIFLQGIGIVVFRLLPDVGTKKIKIVHTLLNIVSFGFIFFGLAAAIHARHHSDNEFKHFFSLHSWIGLLYYTVYAVQFFSGLLVFLFGLGSDEWRDYFAATHAFIGLLLFLLGFLVSEMGIVIKATFCLSQKAKISNELLAFNWVGAMILLFVAAMFYIGVCPYFEWEKIDDQ